MHLVLTSRPPDAASCARWGRAPKTSPCVGPADAIVDHYEAPARIGPSDTPCGVFTRLRDRLLAYDVFPPSIVQATICPEGRITAGATIVQRILLGPLALEAAVRVIDVWDRVAGESAGAPGSVRAAGFRYVTLRGHPECGVASFEVRAQASGEVTVLLDARSRAGTWLTRLGRPFARRFQRAMTQAALRRLADAS
jgi:uncharacterized protein (UPF0548 family)